jgi:hypothetical protein
MPLPSRWRSATSTGGKHGSLPPPAGGSPLTVRGRFTGPTAPNVFAIFGFRAPAEWVYWDVAVQAAPGWPHAAPDIPHPRRTA